MPGTATVDLLHVPSTLAEPRQPRLIPLPPGWPLFALVAGFPAWWLLGLGAIVLPMLALPMAWSLLQRRGLVVPAGFGWWLLFLVWVSASATMLGLEPPGTVDGSAVNRLLPFSSRLLSYLAATVVLLYVVNASERLLSQARLVLLHVLFFLEVLTLGLLAMLFPRATFSSPLSAIVPASLANNDFFVQRTELSFAQVQDVLGYESPRPAAPFIYTNTWGSVISLLLVWLVAWGVSARGVRRRLAAVAGVGVAAVPIVYSLNRGVWLGLGLAVSYAGFRLARRGRLATAVGLGAAAAVALAAILASPLSTTIADRLANPHSNEARATVTQAAIAGVPSSPVLGFGSTRDIVGSNQSITVGRTADCPKCGNAAIGGAGHLWLVLFSQGVVGVLLYVGLFLRTLWSARNDDSPIGLAGSTVLLMGLMYMAIYGHVGMPLVLYMVAIALLTRNRQARSVPRLQVGR